MERIKTIVKDALNGFLSPLLAHQVAERIARRAKANHLVLIEERFVVWNSYEEKKPDIWLDENGQYIDFAIQRKGPWKISLAWFDGKRFFVLEGNQKRCFDDVTLWVQMPILM